jgi:nucleotide-binding universal stress UspA family protein
MKRILVAVDGSPRQAAVVKLAREVAEKMGAQLTLFRAVGLPVEYPASILAVSPDTVGELLERSARAQLDALAQELPPALVAGVRVDLGSAWRTICDAARELKADLIVIGSHGYGGIDRLLGTTAARIVNHADRPVLVVR